MSCILASGMFKPCPLKVLSFNWHIIEFSASPSVLVGQLLLNDENMLDLGNFMSTSLLLPFF